MGPGTCDAVFDAARVAAETARFNDALARRLSAWTPWERQPPQQVRDRIDAGQSWLGPVRCLKSPSDRRLPQRCGAVPIRVYRPDAVEGVLLHIHGGGFVLLRPAHSDGILMQLARSCRVAVVSVDYRLAPEHPYPAAADDCEAVAQWLVENAAAEFGTGRILVGGESAGANLAVVTLVRMRDRHGFDGFAGANLVYGCYDCGMTPSQRRGTAAHPVMRTALLKWFYDHYVPPAQRRDPDVSPLYAELARLPPALFTVGTLDPLIDDTLFMYARWRAAGNRAELALYPGGLHGFDRFALTIARDSRKRAAAFIRGRLLEAQRHL